MTPELSSLFLYRVPIFLEFLLLLEALPRPTTGQLLAQPQTVMFYHSSLSRIAQVQFPMLLLLLHKPDTLPFLLYIALFPPALLDIQAFGLHTYKLHLHELEAFSPELPFEYCYISKSILKN